MEGVKFSYHLASFGLGLGLTAPTPISAHLSSPLLVKGSLLEPEAKDEVPAGTSNNPQDLPADGPVVIRCNTDAYLHEPPEAREESAPGTSENDFIDLTIDDGDVPQEPQEQDVIEMDLDSDEDQQPQQPQQPPGEFIEIPVEENAQVDANQQRAVAAAKEISDAAIKDIGQKPYWMRRCRNIQSPFLRLHQEIVELVELLQPAPEEVAARTQAVEAVTEAVKAIWPTAEVHVFGSFATGLFVPTSDVDLVVMNSNCTDVPAGLKALAAALMRKQVAKSVQVIAKARVPIVKFETQEYGGLAFDVSFDVANGPQAADLVRMFVGSWPMMRPLVLVLKLFLQQRELNEVYSGGIGSYALITMVAAFLQLHTSRKPKPSRTDERSKSAPRPGSSMHANSTQAKLLEPSLGVLLVDFFRLFGRVINMPEIGITVTAGGRFFRKDEKPNGGWVNPERPLLLSVEDPKDATNDICRSSYNVRLVKAAFDFAYQQLTAPILPDESMLARILRLGPILISRKPPVDISSLYGKPPPRFKGDDTQQDGQQDTGQQVAATGRQIDGNGKAELQDKPAKKEREQKGDVVQKESKKRGREGSGAGTGDSSAGGHARSPSRYKGSKGRDSPKVQRKDRGESTDRDGDRGASSRAGSRGRSFDRDDKDDKRRRV